jgi:hypothetical protein
VLSHIDVSDWFVLDLKVSVQISQVKLYYAHIIELSVLFLVFCYNGHSQKDWLKEIFDEGTRTKKKRDPDDVSKEMQRALNGDGTSMFAKEEYRTTSQIASFFGTLSSKQRHEKVIEQAEEVVNKMPHCFITIKTGKQETEMRLCEVDVAAWVESLKLSTLQIVGKQLGILGKVKDKSNAIKIREEIVTHVGLCSCKGNSND